MKTIEHWIGGQLTPGLGTRTAPVWNPATGTQQAQVMLAEAADVAAAVRAAASAAGSWRETSLSRRTGILFNFRQLVHEHLDELAGIVSAEHGKVVSDARGEVQRGLEVIEFACGIPQLLKGEYSDQVSGGVDTYTYRQPLGVVAGITPFNFPVMVPCWMHPVAIACGNTFVLKPSERDPSVSLLIAQLWAQAGLPDGVFNVVHGDKVAVDALIDDPRVAAVSFVGSTPIARYVHGRASAAGKRVQALGGAKNHAVVLPDADLEFAAEHLTAAAYGSAGQRCMAVSVAVAVGEAAEPLVEKLRQRATTVRVGAGWDETSEMGPVVTQQAKDRIVACISAAEAQGAAVVVDGRELRAGDLSGGLNGDLSGGFFVGPTLIDQVTPEMSAYTEEIFGPVLVVMRVDTLDQAIELVNANPYGNGAALFTSSGEAARRFQRELSVGMIGINVPIPVPMAFHSFGGWKDSLFGEYHVHGPEGIRFNTRAKVITTRWPQAAKPVAASYQFPTAD